MYINCFYILKSLDYYPITTIYVELEFEMRGRPDSYAYYSQLINEGEISKIPLDIEDLVEMANIPRSKSASDAELSCFVIAKRIGGKVLTDDTRAIKYIQRYIDMPQGSIIRSVEILIEAYLENHLGDHELKSIQQIWEDNNIVITFNLLNEAARRRWMTGESS
jgi:hypothetical protein